MAELSITAVWDQPDHRGVDQSDPNYAPGVDANGNRLIQVAVADQATYGGQYFLYVADDDLTKGQAVLGLWQALGRPA